MENSWVVSTKRVSVFSDLSPPEILFIQLLQLLIETIWLSMEESTIKILFLLGIHFAWLNIHLEAWRYMKKKHKKIRAYNKSVQKELTVKRCVLILDLKAI